MKCILRSDIPPHYQSRDDLHTTALNLADEPTLANWPPQVPEQRCLEYHYTKLGRWPYFGQWTPQGTRAEMPWIPIHKTWQMTLLWPMDPPRRWSEKDEVHMDNTYACTVQIQSYPPPRIWSAQGEMYMHITYACTVQMQTYPPNSNWTQTWDINCYFEMTCTDCDILMII